MTTLWIGPTKIIAEWISVFSAKQISRNPVSTNLQDPDSLATKGIYRWTDAQSVIQYGDIKPSDHNLIIEDKSKEFAIDRPLRVDIRTISHRISPDTQAKLEVAISAIFEIYSHALGFRHKVDYSPACCH
ncbi:MAG: hypothetical protein JKY67_14475 [Pseudomonadales bacterium]|nr:hypothetical protein [Pseudomonadales bacterium]